MSRSVGTQWLVKLWYGMYTSVILINHSHVFEMPYGPWPWPWRVYWPRGLQRWRRSIHSLYLWFDLWFEHIYGWPLTAQITLFYTFVVAFRVVLTGEDRNLNLLQSLIITSSTVWMTNHPKRKRGMSYVTHFCQHNSGLGENFAKVRSTVVKRCQQSGQALLIAPV